MSGPSRLPWGRPKRELVLLGLVAVAALSPLNIVDTQDQTRACLAKALVHGRLYNDGCLSVSRDRASFNGHLYTDKAPGLSVIEVPSVEAMRLGDPATWPVVSRRLWVVRVLSTGLAFMLCAFLVGRISEGLAPGYGGAALVAFSLGTLAGPFAASGFDHVPAGVLGLSAFALAWGRRPLLAGLLAGAAVFTEYEAGPILIVVGIYVLLQGARPLLRYAAGALPGLALLASYNWLAFGAPWRLSYRYVAAEFSSEQQKGFFGISLPHTASVHAVFLGSGGLLLVSPVVIAATYGLVLLGKEHLAEAAVCAAISAIFLIINCGYFLPYGGASPGPRFLIPALPFVALGLGPAFARHPRVTAALATLSVIPMTAVTLTWGADLQPRHTIWGELARLPIEAGRSPFYHALASNAIVPTRLGVGPAALVVAAVAAAALIAAIADTRKA